MKTLIISTLILFTAACGREPTPIANAPYPVYVVGRSGDCMPCGGIECPQADSCVCGNIMDLNKGTSKPFCMSEEDWKNGNYRAN